MLNSLQQAGQSTSSRTIALTPPAPNGALPTPENSPSQGRQLIAALQAIRRQLPADAQLLLAEGESNAQIVRESCLPSSGRHWELLTPAALAPGQQPDGVADILIRHRESVDAGPLGAGTSCIYPPQGQRGIT